MIRGRWFLVILPVMVTAVQPSTSSASVADCSCIHLGQNVNCPAGLSPGSHSVEFVPGGTLWETPGGTTVTVPQTTFTCTPSAPSPTTPPKAPVTPPPVTTTPPVTTPPPATTPPPQTPPTPPRTPPSVTPPDQSTQKPPTTPPSDLGRGSEDRARRLIEPPQQPPIVVPTTPPPDDGKTTDDLIRRLGREIKEQPPVSPPVPPTYSPPDQPPTYGPGEPPTYGPGGPPTIYRTEKKPTPVCCGITDKLITFPITTDPMQPPSELEAARDPAVGGMQVFLHDGGFFTNAIDVSVPKFFYNMQWTRHYRSDAKFKEGGLLGHGWDFFYNKRVVPWGREYQNGLLAEHIGEDTPKLTYYNGTGRAEVYVAKHSEERHVENFDTEFRAYVTTYVSPAGTFHEIERYVLFPGEPHAFAEHKNVEPTERIFYVLREKDGTRYVFNCRGQLIYVLSRNDSPSKRIRVELRYREPLNPLTQNLMLYEIVPAVGKSWLVDTIDIGQGVVRTNLHCQLVSGVLPIKRIQRLRAGTTTIAYEYRGSGDGPVLDSVRKSAADPTAKFPVNPRQWQYTYDGDHRVTDIKNPNECAKGGAGKPYLHNTYSGDKVQSQTLGGEETFKADFTISRTPVVSSVPMTFTFNYGAGTASVTDAKNNKQEFALEKVGGYFVIASITVTDPDAANGGPWTTRYKHNGQTQIEEITYPAGNGVTFEYEGGNKPVTLGPIRDWVERKWTYENNLAQGNLKSVTKHEAGMGTMVTRAPGATYSGPSTSASRRSYEELYNQLEETIDALGNKTKFHYTDYDTPKHRGNPMSMQDPPVLQPDQNSTSVERPETTFTYDEFAQHESMKEGGKQIAKYEYNDARYIRRAEYRGGSYENLRYDALGNIIQRTSQDGVVDYGRDPFGQVRRKTVDPTGLALASAYEYDNNGNAIESRTEVKDTFGNAAEAKALGLAPTATYWMVEKTTYDLLDREQSRTLSAQGLTYQTVSGYDSAGDLQFTIEPPRDGWEAFKTTFRNDARHLVRETVLAAGTDASRAVRRGYDDNGDLSLIETGSGTDVARSTMHYNGLGRIDLATDPLGAQRNLVYDAAGNLTEQTVKGGAGVLQHASYAYTAYQQVIRRTVDTLIGSAQEVSKWFYSDRLTLAKTVSPNGSETTFDYDAQDRLEYVTDALGNKTRNRYDGAGNLVSVEATATEHSRDAASGKYTDEPKTITTTTTYDTAGRVTGVTTTSGRERRFLDSLGRVRGAVSVTGQMTTMAYDGLGRQTDLKNALTSLHKSYTFAGLVKGSTGPDGDYRFTYDALGRALARTDQGTGAVMTYHYEGRVVETTDGNGTKVRTTHNGGNLPVDVTVTPSNRIRIPPRNQTAASIAASIQAGPGSAGSQDRPFDIVQGVTREHFDYDELGRVVKATNGETNQRDSSTIVRKYDGLGRLTEDRQSGFADTHSVAYRYADDFSWSEVTYPEIASSARYRFHSDAIGRIDAVTLDDINVARFDYTGLDRVATRSARNGVVTHFGYDAAARLNEVSTVRNFAGNAQSLLWRIFATYDPVGFSTVTEFTPGRGDQGDVAFTTYFKHDRLGRVTSASTGLVTSASIQAPAAGQAAKTVQSLQVTGVLSELSGSFNTYDGAKLVAMAEYGGIELPRQGAKGAVGDVFGCLGSPVSCVQGFSVRSLRLDRFAYDGRQRVGRVTTSGAVDARVWDFPNGVEAVAKIVQVRSGASDVFTAGSRTPPTDQVFEYDRNGNLIDDGRYYYAYDFKNRLVLVQDTWAPNGYDEYTGFIYDPLDRRVTVYSNRIDRNREAGGGMRFNNPWTAGTTRLVYDGERVIAESWASRDAETRLTARYFYGAHPGELLRMDGRPRDQPKQPLRSFFVHQDLNGTIRFVSDDDGRLHAIENEAPLTVGKTGAEAAAGDENMIAANVIGDKTYKSSGIRMPYVGSGTRIDGFAGVTYRDDVKQPVVNFRSAANFVRATERRIIADQRLTIQNQLQATVGLMVALPVGAAVAIPATAAEFTWASIGWSALGGGAVQTGLGFTMAWLNGVPYGPGDAGLDFVQGASFGAAGKVIGAMGLSGVYKAATEVATFTGAGVGWGVARSGRLDLDTVFGNAVMSVALSGAGSGIGWAWKSAKSSLFNVVFDAAESAPGLPAAVKEEIVRPQALAEAEPIPPRENAFFVKKGVPVTGELRAVPAKIMGRLEASRIPAVMEAVQRLRAGVLKVALYGKGQKKPDPAGAKYNTTRWEGYYTSERPDVIWLNADKLNRVAGVINDLWAASVIVHESIHAMGGNELCAFFGQARFILESGEWWSIPSSRFRAFYFIYLKEQLRDAVYAIGAGPDPNAPGGIMGYAAKTPGWLRLEPPSPWLVQQGGWAKALQVAHPGFEWALANPARTHAVASPP